jgi:hypothetical protein
MQLHATPGAIAQHSQSCRRLMREMTDISRIADHEIDTRWSLSNQLFVTLSNSVKRDFLAMKKSVRRLDI